MQIENILQEKSLSLMSSCLFETRMNDGLVRQDVRTMKEIT